MPAFLQVTFAVAGTGFSFFPQIVQRSVGLGHRSKCLGHTAGKCASHRGEEEENRKREMTVDVSKYKGSKAMPI